MGLKSELVAQEETNKPLPVLVRLTVQGKEKAKAMLRHLLPRKGSRSKRAETTHSDGASLRLRKVLPGTTFQPSKNSKTQRTKGTHSIRRNTLIPKKEKCLNKPTTQEKGNKYKLSLSVHKSSQKFVRQAHASRCKFRFWLEISVTQ